MVTYEIFIGAMFSMLLLGAGGFYWLMSEMRKLRQEVRQEIRELRAELLAEFRSEIRAEAEERRADTQRILEALYFHRHDDQGAAVFYPPPRRTDPNGATATQAPRQGTRHDHAAIGQN